MLGLRFQGSPTQGPIHIKRENTSKQGLFPITLEIKKKRLRSLYQHIPQPMDGAYPELKPPCNLMQTSIYYLAVFDFYIPYILLCQEWGQQKIKCGQKKKKKKP